MQHRLKHRQTALMTFLMMLMLLAGCASPLAPTRPPASAQPAQTTTAPAPVPWSNAAGVQPPTATAPTQGPPSAFTQSAAPDPANVRLAMAASATDVANSAPSMIMQESPPLAVPAMVRPPETATPHADLQAALHELLSIQRGQYGVHAVDLTTGTTYSYNADGFFPAASTFKLPVAMYVLQQISEGKAALSDEIAFTADELESGSGSLQGWIGEGDRVPIGELLRDAMTESDNIAHNMLVHHFGQGAIMDWMKALGGRADWWDEDSVGATPRELALYMQLAATPDFWADPTLRELLLGHLSHTIYPTRIAAGVPDGVPVAHKIGSWPVSFGDVGFVMGERPFVIAILSHEVAEPVADEVLAATTKLVYDHLTTAPKEPAVPAPPTVPQESAVPPEPAAPTTPPAPPSGSKKLQ